MGGRPGYPYDRPRGRYGGRGYQGGQSGKHQFLLSALFKIIEVTSKLKYFLANISLLVSVTFGGIFNCKQVTIVY